MAIAHVIEGVEKSIRLRLKDRGLKLYKSKLKGEPTEEDAGLYKIMHVATNRVAAGADYSCSLLQAGWYADNG